MAKCLGELRWFTNVTGPSQTSILHDEWEAPHPRPARFFAAFFHRINRTGHRKELSAVKEIENLPIQGNCERKTSRPISAINCRNVEKVVCVRFLEGLKLARPAA